MGKIKKGILGSFSGKVGTVVGAVWNGIGYMRSLPSSVTNPNTEKQQSQRSRFSLVLAFLKAITAFIREGYKLYASGKTAFNAAMSYIVQNAISGEYPDFSLDYSAILVARGSLTAAQDAAADISADAAAFSWVDNSGTGTAAADDVAMLLVFDIDRTEAIYSTAGGVRSDASASLSLPSYWAGETVEAYLAFQSADGTAVSNSSYLGEFTVPTA